VTGRWAPWPPDVPSTPPAWQEQEWCDGGWTCQHPDCLQAWQEEAADQQQEADQLDGSHRW
jgi:hypothetical protein